MAPLPEGTDDHARALAPPLMPTCRAPGWAVARAPALCRPPGRAGAGAGRRARTGRDGSDHHGGGLPGRRRHGARRDPGLPCAPAGGRGQGGQPAVRRSPHGDDHGAVDLVLPAGRDGARGRLRRPLRARRRPRGSRRRALRHSPFRIALRALCAAPGARTRCVNRGRAAGHRARHAAVPARRGRACRDRRGRSHAQLGFVRRRRRQAACRRRRSPGRPRARSEGHPDPHRGAAGRGPVLRRALARAGQLAAFRACVRGGARGAQEAARRPAGHLVQRVERGAAARNTRHADERRLARRSPAQLARAGHARPVARGATARRFACRLWRHLPRHSPRCGDREQGARLGVHPTDDARPRRAAGVVPPARRVSSAARQPRRSVLRRADRVPRRPAGATPVARHRTPHPGGGRAQAGRLRVRSDRHRARQGARPRQGHRASAGRRRAAARAARGARRAETERCDSPRCRDCHPAGHRTRC